MTEFKYLTRQKHDKTTVVYEYPQDEVNTYYPVPRAENANCIASTRLWLRHSELFAMCSATGFIVTSNVAGVLLRLTWSRLAC